MPRSKDQDTLLKALQSWFETSASGNWTLVIDNLDDIELQSRDYIPVRHGEILFTTRDRRVLGHPGLVPARAGIEVPRMSEKEAMETFCRIVGSEDSVGCAATGQLLTLLDGLPLAIAQAAAYIRTTQIPTASYLALFQQNEKKQQELLSEPLPAALRKDKNDHSRAVMTTWQLTVQMIEQENPLSIKILQIMSFLDPENLPFSFIQEALSAEAQSPFEQLALLLNFGLLTRLESSNYRLHRLVSMWTRAKMSSEVKHQCIDRGIALMTTFFPQESSDNVTKYIEMLPHALSILDHMGSDGSKFGSESSWELQQNVIHFLTGIGQLHLAMKHARRSLEQEKVFEKDNSKRYISRARLGGIYYSMADYATAIKEYRPALDGLESTLGKDHYMTLHAVHNMAIIFQDTGEYDKALGWYQRALDGKEKAFGKGHPDTLSTVHNMATVFQDKGEHDKALEWYQHALDGQEMALGKNHRETLKTVNNIAVIFRDKGEYDKALEWYQRALDSREVVLGRDHPDTLATVNNMGTVFGSRGEYGKALEWYQRALDSREVVLGKDHPDTLATVNNIAVQFQSKEEYDNALDWYQRALDGQEKVIGKDHPKTLTTVHNMASVFKHKGEHNNAIEFYQRALAGQERAHGEDHPGTLSIVSNIASVFQDKGEHGKALEWYQRALVGQEKTLGKDHPHTLVTVSNLAGVYLNKGEYDKALEWHQRALDGCQKVLGKGHPTTINLAAGVALLRNLSGSATSPAPLPHRESPSAEVGTAAHYSHAQPRKSNKRKRT